MPLNHGMWEQKGRIKLHENPKCKSRILDFGMIVKIQWMVKDVSRIQIFEKNKPFAKKELIWSDFSVFVVFLFYGFFFAVWSKGKQQS